jgi:hypothetical protein
LIIFSIEPELLRFLEADSSEFETIIANLPAVEGGWLSAPIFTHALFVHLSKDAHNCTSMFGSTEDSAGSRGIISPFNSFREVDSAERERFTKALEKIDQYSELRKQVEPESIRAPVLENCIPQGRRFLLKPDESDSFHCQVTGNEPGIYFFRFKVAFHYESKKAVRYSDQVYPCFAGIGFLASAIRE